MRGIVLIDTQWNVNLPGTPVKKSAPSFNRYIVECKYRITFLFRFTAVVLIDTQWNVNPEVPHIGVDFYAVLIDTQWNVNDVRYGGENNSVGFNRYIVECKCSSRRCGKVVNSVLIDTQWNVNDRVRVQRAAINQF